MEEFISFIVKSIGDLGYIGIFLMMVLESSFIPFPSELAMIPAGYLAFNGEMNFSLALIIGTFGAIIGATINYFIAYKLGEKITINLIKKYGKILFIKEKHYKKAENYFLKHGSITIFLSRFIPAVRQLISLPAGSFQMNYNKFFIYTGFGALLWNLILMSIGYVAGQNQELIKQYSNKALIFVLIISLILILIYVLNIKIKKGANKGH